MHENMSPSHLWLKGLSLILVGGVILLQKLAILPETTWGWVWPLLVLVWGVVFLYKAGTSK